MVCRALELARSSFYAAAKAKIKQNKLDKTIWNDIVNLWKKLPGIGYRKIALYIAAGEKKIQRILRKYRSNKRTNHKIKKERKFPNLIIKITKDLIDNPIKQLRNNWIIKDGKNGYRKLIEPTRPCQLWAGDWKELKIHFLGLTLYIFIIIDVYTRKLMGYSFSIIKDSGSAIKAGMMAIENADKDYSLFNPKTLIMHTDQGSAYIATDYINYWNSIGVHLSMADRGKPTQNPYAEAFNSILVRFWITQHELLTVVEAEKSLTKFFHLYNTFWKHGGIGNLTPDEKLAEYINNHISKSANMCPKTGA